jgi:asparagine synthase (glutamine-hydrolysing)
MCGIAGILDPNIPEDKLRSTLASMGATLAHRGPDDSGIWLEGSAGVGFSHRRLAIIDISPGGHQPMVSTSGRFVIAYNGEIYNFVELRELLASQGMSFSGTSDTEVMLAAIESWGLAEAVGRFAGMFSFALWDRKTRTLSLVRDRLGIKPLYWSRQGRQFLFGSELKALRACPDLALEINRDALAAYMRWSYVPAPHSIFRNVHKLEPGTILTVKHGQAPAIEHYWSARRLACEATAHATEPNDDEARKTLDDLLRRSVAQHMVSDVPLGAFLSGGIDSSLVVALMQAQSTQPVRTFSIGFHEERYNEAKQAKSVAEHLRTDHTELYVELRHAQAIIPRMPEYFDEPFGDSSQLPTYLVAEMTRRHVSVALSGDGGDELFAGYSRYQWAEMVHQRFGRLPLALRRMIAAIIETVPGSVWTILNRVLPDQLSAGRLEDRMGKLAYYMSRTDGNAIYRAQHAHWPSGLVLDGSESKGITWDKSLAETVPDFVTRMQLMDLLQYLPDDILTKVDRATMAVSLEARVPLLDHRIVDFALKLPKRHKRRGKQTKWLLRQVLYDYVPRELIDRPKMGFAAPIGQWLREPLRDWSEELLDERRLTEDGFFNAKAIRAGWNSYLAGNNALREPIWGVLMFQAWHEAQK